MINQGSVYLNSVAKPFDWIINQVSNSLEGRKSLEELDDQHLASLAQNGDDKAFETLLRRYQKLVYNIVYQMCRNHAEAADITQDTFLKVFRALDSFDNTCLNSLRKRKADSSLDDESVYFEPVEEKDASVELEQKVSLRTLQKALEAIPENQRETFILKYQHDLSYNEISEITGLSISSIKSLLFRARESLRKKLTLGKDGVEEAES